MSQLNRAVFRHRPALTTALVCMFSFLAFCNAGQAQNASGKRALEVESVELTSAELSAQLGKKWGRVLTEGYGLSEIGLKQFVDGHASYPTDVLKRALSAKNFEAMNQALMSHNQQLVNARAEHIRNTEEGMDPAMHSVKAASMKLLGDEARDLVYIPITPCRTFDTRFSTESGSNFMVTPATPISALAFWFGLTSNWTVYGGQVASCPDTVQSGTALAGGAPYAVAMNLGVVSPTADGWVTAYRYGLLNPSSTVVSKLVRAGVNDTALVIVNVCRGVIGPPCIGDIAIASQNTNVHVAGDVVGYFIRPQATALDCADLVTSGVTFPAGGLGTLSTANCATGYSITGGGCSMSNFDGRVVTSRPYISGSNQNYFCAFRNEGTSTVEGFAYARCCRTPGR